MAFSFGNKDSGSTGNNIFGQTTGAGGNPFGTSTAPSTSGAPTTNLFGASTTPSTAPTTNLFGQASSAKSNTPSALFSSAATATKPTFSFGAPASTAPPSLFETATTANTTVPLFGAKPATSGGSGNLFGGANAASGNAGAGSQATGLFGPAPTTTGTTSSSGNTFSFGQSTAPQSGSSTPTTAGPTTSKPDTGGFFGSATGSTTPATSKPGGMFSFNNSTTPMGTPAPKEVSKAPSNVFSGNATTSTTSGLFGNAGGDKSSLGGLFAGASKPSDLAPSAPVASSNGGGLFGGGANSIEPKPSATPGQSSAGGLFGGGQNTTATSSNGGSSASAAQAPSTTSQKALFGGTPSITTTTANTTAAPAQGGSSLFGVAAAANKPEASKPATTSLFSGFKPAATVSENTPAFTTATSTPSLFAPKATTEDVKPATAPSNPGSTTAGAPTTASAAPVQSAPTSVNSAPSTAGPPPQMSRLKNRTMDEIITRWASDLSKYQKEFQDQALKVASWDRLLVENGEKIQKLYTSTFEAERATTEVEKQLAAVENSQNDLEAFLDHYEHEVDDIFNKSGASETLQGPDQERERTYKLAEKLGDRLDEMGKDLTSMIQEINTASASLNKSTKADDPLQQIVKVLNGHLVQLQWIDQNAASLKTKVTAAQRESQHLAGSLHGGYESNPSDDLFRSYLGRR